MLATARQPRHLALFALATMLAAAFVALGFWQYGVAKDDARREAFEETARQPVVALADLVGPQEAFPKNGTARRVTVSGTYDASKQFLVPGRVLRGADGYWVVTPLVVDATGARLPILRGFVTTPQAAPHAPAGDINISGSLAPSDSPVDVGPLPQGQRGSIDAAALVNEWGGEIYNAFVFVIDQNPAETAPAMQAVPPPSPDTGGFDWRNLGYALQWWVFAFFAYYVWWRTVKEAHADAAAAASPFETTTQAQPDIPEGTHV